MSKFPPDVARLFQPGPPLKYLKPVDYPIHERQTNPHITGLSSYLTHLSDYKKKFPHSSKNQYLTLQTKIIDKQAKHQQQLNENYEHWDPHNDPHMKNTDPYCTIFVGRLPYDIDELELQNIFNRFGDIDKIRIVREKEQIVESNNNKKNKNKKKGKVTKLDKDLSKNKSRGYGFIVFNDPMSSKKCIRETGVHRGIEIHGRKCIVDFERGRTNKYFVPRRFGGGLGNRGYSVMNEHDSSNDNRHRGPSRFQSSSHSQRHSGPRDGYYNNNNTNKFRYSNQNEYHQSSIARHESESVKEQHVVSYRSRVVRTHDNSSKEAKSSLDY